MHPITVETVVRKDMPIVWESWTAPEHITKWNQASPDWECPNAENDLRVGGRFLARMAAKDGSAAFDFTGTYTEVEPHRLIAYTMDDGRAVRVAFKETPDGVRVTETFDPEEENSEEMQAQGWQSILESFRTYTEGLGG